MWENVKVAEIFTNLKSVCLKKKLKKKNLCNAFFKFVLLNVKEKKKSIFDYVFEYITLFYMFEWKLNFPQL